jgi:hypothetical protein
MLLVGSDQGCGPATTEEGQQEGRGERARGSHVYYTVVAGLFLDAEVRCGSLAIFGTRLTIARHQVGARQRLIAQSDRFAPNMNAIPQANRKGWFFM